MTVQDINEFINRGHAAGMLLVIAVLLWLNLYKDEIKKSLRSK